MTDILNKVDRFIKKRMYPYALLINGRWGCGKTYFVKNELINHIKKYNNKVHYISLYGINDTNEIDKQLFVQSIKKTIDPEGVFLDTKVSHLSGVIISTLTKAFLDSKEANSSNVENILSELPNYEDSVIIIDDLERCNCVINEILGYINKFVEHSKASVILVANEEEIGNWQNERNPELQMIVALNPSVDITVEPTEEQKIQQKLNFNNGNNITKFSVNQLEERRKIIFHSNESYKRMKEKVVGQTIEYVPNLKVVLPAIIDSKINNEIELHDIMLSKVDDFIEIARYEDHYNLRTFQFFLEKVSTIFTTIGNKYNDQNDVIINYTYRSSIRHMKGLKMPSWNGRYGIQRLDSKSTPMSAVFGYEFIDDLVYKEHFDSNLIKQVLDQFEEEAKKSARLENDPWQKIKNWYLADNDEELLSWLEQMAENIINGMYSTLLFKEFIGRIADFYIKGIMKEQCDKIYNAMLEYLRKADSKNIDGLGYQHFPPEDKETLIKYNELCSGIEPLVEKAKEYSDYLMYEKAISNIENWGTRLCELSTEYIDNKKHTAIYWIIPSIIVKKIVDSSNSELYQFRLALSNYYGGHIYYEHRKDDLDNLTELKHLLEKLDMSTFQQIKRQYLIWIIKDIGRYMESIK